MIPITESNCVIPVALPAPRGGATKVVQLNGDVTNFERADMKTALRRFSGNEKES